MKEFVHLHLHTEYSLLDGMATIKKVVKMLQDASNITEPFEYIPSSYENYLAKLYPEYSLAYGYENDDFNWDPSYGVSKSTWKSWHLPQQDEMKLCSLCNKKDYEYNLFPTKTIEGGTIFLCSDCVSNNENISWCDYCGEPFVLKNNEMQKNICYDCRQKGEIRTSGLLKD